MLPAHRPAAQPLVPEMPEQLQVSVAADLGAGVEVELPGELEPERAPGIGAEMPGHHLAYVGVEPFPGGGSLFGQGGGLVSCRGRAHPFPGS